MPDHTFNPILAKDYGTDVAIFLQNIYFWVKRNKAYDKNFYEGRYWTFNSLSAFTEVHIYWSKRQIERIVCTCKKEGLLLAGCFNQDRRDRTCWYTLSDKALTYLTNDTTKTAECISPNGDMHVTEQGQSYHRSVTTIPDIKPDIKQTTPIIPKGDDGRKGRKKDKSVPDWKPERFEAFWTYYRTHARGEDRQGAVRAWDKLRPDDELIAVMGKALQAQVRSEDWQNGFAIPYAKTWLSHRRWEDEPGKPSAVAAPYDEEGRDGI